MVFACDIRQTDISPWYSPAAFAEPVVLASGHGSAKRLWCSPVVSAERELACGIRLWYPPSGNQPVVFACGIRQAGISLRHSPVALACGPGFAERLRYSPLGLACRISPWYSPAVFAEPAVLARGPGSAKRLWHSPLGLACRISLWFFACGIRRACGVSPRSFLRQASVVSVWVICLRFEPALLSP